MIFDKERVEIFNVRYLITSTLEKICYLQRTNIFVGLIIIINVHLPIRKLPLELFLFLSGR